MSAVLIPTSGEWREVKPFKSGHCLTILKDALDESVRNEFTESELGIGKGGYLYGTLVHGGEPELVQKAGGFNHDASKLLGLEFRGPIVVFKETKSGSVGQLSLKTLKNSLGPKKGHKRKAEKEVNDDFISGSSSSSSGYADPKKIAQKLNIPIIHESHLVDSKESGENNEPQYQTIPDAKCETCGAKAVYPVVRLDCFNLSLYFCEEHHANHKESRKKNKKNKKPAKKPKFELTATPKSFPNDVQSDSKMVNAMKVQSKVQSSKDQTSTQQGASEMNKDIVDDDSLPTNKEDSEPDSGSQSGSD